VDYQRQWTLLLETIEKLAEEFPKKRFALEYKLKEPRKHLFVSSAMKTLWLVRKLGKNNVGVLVDFGHVLMSKENPATIKLGMMNFFAVKRWSVLGLYSSAVIFTSVRPRLFL
jgi:sugar phosphate isomerase/epimerase